MKIVVLDGHAVNPGDLSWDIIRKFGELEIYDYTAPEDTVSAILAERYSSLFSLIPVSIVFLASASITRFT